MYCDTNSVTYIQPRGENPLIETGDKLVYMTSEFRSLETLKELVSGGPENYAYRVLDTGDGPKRPCVKSVE